MFDNACLTKNINTESQLSDSLKLRLSRVFKVIYDDKTEKIIGVAEKKDL